ncbi:hypothetical protein LMG27198_23770 [Methylocystis echinoides]|uniref:Uncharacterized protein n=1 Tax=Methylocystis echinoides TaxID=29468 RepID=A0A9W6GUZ3_9HYPH|nr:hypothetical protein LMG27198_23770 [Methylocystis echinoides]
MKALEDVFPDYVKANSAGLPDWIPAPVRDYATHNEFDKRALPLLHDERMKSVWRELSRHRESGDAVLVAVFQQLQGVAGGGARNVRGGEMDSASPFAPLYESPRGRLGWGAVQCQADRAP